MAAISNPRVSVIIPCYNSRRYIEETINCALDHDYDNLEVIVIDDGSADGSDEIIKAFGTRVKSIRTENRGVSAARNTGMEMATGEYLQFLDSDDLILPGKIQQQVTQLEESGADAVMSDFLRLIGDKRIAPLNFHSREMFDSVEEFVMYTLHLLGRCLFRASAARTAGGFPPFARSEDFAFHFQLIAVGAKWIYSPGKFFLYRMHEDVSRLASLESVKRTPDQLREVYGYVEEFLKKNGRYDDAAKKALSYDSYRQAMRFYQLGMPGYGDSYLKMARNYWDPPVLKGSKIYLALHKILGCRLAGKFMGSWLFRIIRKLVK